MSLRTVSFQGEVAQYLVPTWQDLDRLTLKLAKKILGSGESFDLVVALAKGAWPMSRSLVDYLAMEQMASLGVRFYSGINQRLTQPEVYQDLPVSVRGKRILLFDDVADTGESLEFVQAYLRQKGALEVKTATLFLKDRSVVRPEYFAARTNAWIIFPFELREMMTLLGKSWRKQGVTESLIKERFQQLKFPVRFSSYFNL